MAVCNRICINHIDITWCCVKHLKQWDHGVERLVMVFKSLDIKWLRPTDGLRVPVIHPAVSYFMIISKSLMGNLTGI